MLLVAFPLPLLRILPLPLQSCPEMLRHVLRRDGRKDLVDAACANVDQHVRVGESLHRALHLRLGGGLSVRLLSWVTVRRDGTLAAEVVLEDFAIRDGDDAVIVEAEPASVGRRLDENEVVTAVNVTGMDEDAMQLVEVRFGAIGALGEVGLDVDLERELVTVVDLCERVKSDQYVRGCEERKRRKAHLDVLVSLHIVLKPLELEMENGRERLEDDALLRILQPETLGVVAVLAIESFDLDVVLERLLEVLEVLDVELNVCRLRVSVRRLAGQGGNMGAP
jgi:hypothetical protein